MNIMLTCAGRRSHTITVFQDAVRNRGCVYACDASAEAPALQEADEAFVVPQVDAPDYVEALVALCREHRVRLLVPALEPELPLLAAARERFLEVGTFALVSSPEVIATCYDKLATAKFLASAELAMPRTFLSLAEARTALARGEIQFPLVVKPRWGVSSIALSFPADDEELELCFRLAGKQIARGPLAKASAADPGRCILIQEHLHGDEYGLDIVNDLEGRYVCTFIKRKLRMRAGQTDRAITVRDADIEALGRTIGQRLGHVGLLDCDLFVTDTGSYAIDLNPRIGGGYPFSHLAGANIPAALVAWAEGREPEANFFHCTPDVAAARDDSFIVRRSTPAKGPLLSMSASFPKK